MLDRVKYDTASVLTRIEIRTEDDLRREEEARQQRLMQALQTQHAEAQSLLGAGGNLIVDAESGASDGEGRSGAAPGASPRRIGTRGGPVPFGQAAVGAGGGATSSAAVAPFVRGDRKVGRNEPCPCGSGKKFKVCHGALADAG